MRIAANISLMFGEMPLLSRFAAARDSGFDGVEIQFPYSESPEALERAVEDAGIPVVLMNAPIVPGTHPAGIAGRPELREDFRAQLPMICAYAQALGAPLVHVLAGRCSAADEREFCRDTYVDNLLFAASVLGTHGVQVLIEALNPHDVPNYLVNSLADAQSILERCNGRVGLQFDAYHVARMGLDPAAELERLLPVVRHVQFADAPGRHEPGTGCVSFEPIIAVLERAGYCGWLGAEYVPRSTTAAGLRWLRAWRVRPPPAVA